MMKLLKRHRAIFIAALCLAICVYLVLVFIAAGGRRTSEVSFDILRTDVPTLPRPTGTDCPPPDANLSPNGNFRAPEFKEYGNLWLLDSAATTMYDERLMDYPKCLNYAVHEVAASRFRRVLVVYNRALQKELIVVRNYP